MGGMTLAEENFVLGEKRLKVTGPVIENSSI